MVSIKEIAKFGLVYITDRMREAEAILFTFFTIPAIQTLDLKSKG